MTERRERIAVLEDEIRKLEAELKRAKEREKETGEARRAMLYLLEDINDVSSEILRAKNEWESTFDSISDLLLIHDHEMRIIRCNRAYRDAAGLRFKEIIGRRYYEVFPKMEGPMEICRRCTVDGECGSGEDEEFFSRELDKVFKVRVYPASRTGEGQFVHAMEDVTEAKKAERKLRLSEELYRGLVDTSTDAIISINAGGEITQWNEAARRIFGYTMDEAIGRPVDIIVPERERKKHAEGMKRLLEKGTGKLIGKTTEVEGLRKDGAVIPVELSLSALKEGGSYIFTGIIREITERKKAEDKLRREMELTKNLLMIAGATTRTSDMERLMEEVVKSVKGITNCGLSLSYLWDREERVFQPCRGAGLGPEMLHFFRAEPLDPGLPPVARAFEGKTTVAEAPGGAGRAVMLRWAGNINKMVFTPLMGKKDRLGLLVCIYSRADAKNQGDLPKRDKDVMDGISHHVSIALEEARLYKESIDRAMELSRKVETIQTMHEIDKYILSTLEPRDILEASTRMVARLIPCDRATIALADRGKSRFVYSAGFGVGFLTKEDFINFKDTDMTEVIRTGRPQYVPDLADWEPLLPIEGRLIEEGFISHIRVPLLVKDEVAGVLSVGARRRAAYSPEDLSTLEKLASQIGVALENARLLSDLEGLFLSVVRTLSKAIDAKSPWTSGHSERVTDIAERIGRRMKLDDKALKDLRLAGLLHDIGKLGTYEHILDKPGKLTPDELRIIRLHPVKGSEILAPIKQMANIVPGIRHHHENYDGTGYPDGLKGEEIPLIARILCVADTVDAMSADRPYRKGKSKEAIMEELRRCSSTQFDPAVVEAFLRTEWLDMAV